MQGNCVCGCSVDWKIEGTKRQDEPRVNWMRLSDINISEYCKYRTMKESKLV
jgi:hypothetical protein